VAVIAEAERPVVGALLSIPRRTELQVAAIWLAARVALLVLSGGLFAWTSTHPGPLAVGWARWDTDWYLQIAARGYWETRSTGFFPLYPLAVAAAARAGVPPLVGALAIANVGSLAALLVIARMAREVIGDGTGAVLAAAVVTASPFAFFLAAGYADGPFLALAAGSLMAARHGSWRTAAACAFVAGLTRPSAVVLIPALLFEFVRQRGWRPAGWRWTAELAANALAVPAAIGLYMAYLWQRFGDPLEFVHVQQLYWHHDRLAAPWDGILAAAVQLTNGDPYDLAVFADLAAVLAFAAMTVVLARRGPVSFFLYTAGVLYLCVGAPMLSLANPISSSGRYLLAAFPIFLLVTSALRDRPRLLGLTLTSSAVVQFVLASVFLLGGPVF
jgi:hypothetical protein